MPEEMSCRDIPIEKLRWRCDPGIFSFESTAEVVCSNEIIGQERATRAIKLGLSVSSRGYNREYKSSDTILASPISLCSSP